MKVPLAKSFMMKNTSPVGCKNKLIKNEITWMLIPLALIMKVHNSVNWKYLTVLVILNILWSCLCV